MEKLTSKHEKFIKKANIILITFIISFSLFFMSFIYIKNNYFNKTTELVQVKNGFKVDIKDLVVNNKIYRYIIVYENDVLLLIKLCDDRITHQQEKAICMKDRKMIWYYLILWISVYLWNKSSSPKLKVKIISLLLFNLSVNIKRYV